MRCRSITCLEIWVNIVIWSGMQPAFEEMVHADLTFPESIVLRMLQRAPLSVADVAEGISITQSAASRVVDRLVHDGFVERQENPSDGGRSADAVAGGSGSVGSDRGKGNARGAAHGG